MIGYARCGEVAGARTHGQPRVARLTRALAWAALAILAFTLLGLGQIAADAGGNVLDVRLAAYVLVVATGLTAAVGAPVALAHATAGAITRRRGGELQGQLWVAAAVGVLAIVPAVQQAAFLTSGTAISRSEHVGLVRVGIAIAIVVGLPAAWLWHALATRNGATAGLRASLPRLGPAIDGRAGRALWWVAGVAFTWTCVQAVAELRAYVSFAAFLVPLVWLATATMTGRLLVVWPSVGRGLAWAVGVLACVAAIAALVDRTLLVEGRTRLLGIAPVVTLADLGLASPQHGAIRFDLELAAREACPAAPAIDASARARVPGRSVILVSIDALRQDARGPRDDGPPSTPNLDAFAAGGLDFTRAVTTYPATLFALGSALTGRSPRAMMLAARPPDGILRLAADRFDRRIAILPDSEWFRLPATERLLLQGTPAELHRDAQAQVDALVTALRDARAAEHTVLAWVHLYEPHAPYVPHAGFERGAGDQAAYASEVAWVDAQLGRLFAQLARDGWLEDTLVIVFADHGEALGERGYWGHHVALDRWLTDVPLVVRAPGISPAVREDLVDVGDIAATVLDFVGVALPAGASGRSLLGPPREPDATSIAEAFPVRGEDLFAIAAEPIASVDALVRRAERLEARAVSYEPKVSVTTSRWRFVVHRISGLVELFDRDADPAQAENLAFVRTDVVADLSARLRNWHEETARAIRCEVEPR
jgi:arylsulfatase A-like enzyme